MKSGKIIIVEGPDCSGKTSLAKRIAFTKRAVYFHASGKPGFHSCMQDYHENIIMNAQINAQNGIHVVLDRLWPSELVYGGIFRPELKEKYDFATIIKSLDHSGVEYIFCHDLACCSRHEEERDETHPYSAEDYDRVYREYVTLDGIFHDMVGALVAPAMIKSPIRTHHYSILEHGNNMDPFIERLFS